MRVLVATDAWHPQVNGVVRTLTSLARSAAQARRRYRVPDPGGISRACRCRPIRGCGWHCRRAGRSPRASTRSRRMRSTSRPRGRSATSCAPIAAGAAGRSPPATPRDFRNTSRRARRFPQSWIYAALRRFHAAAAVTMVSTPSLHGRARPARVRPISACGRAASIPTCSGRIAPSTLDFPRPIFVSVGRVAVEKNLEAFLSLDLPGTKVVIGKGPQEAELKRRFPAARFLGQLENGTLAGSSGGRRRVRISEPDRHVRRRPARGTGERGADRGLPGHRSEGRGRRQSDRRAATRTCERPASAGAAGFRATPAAHSRSERSWENSARQFIGHVQKRGGRRSPSSPMASGRRPRTAAGAPQRKGASHDRSSGKPSSTTRRSQRPMRAGRRSTTWCSARCSSAGGRPRSPPPSASAAASSRSGSAPASRCPTIRRSNRLCGVDISEPMLLKAQERVAELGLTQRRGALGDGRGASRLSGCLVRRRGGAIRRHHGAESGSDIRRVRPRAQARRRDRAGQPRRRGSRIAALAGAVVRAGGAQARLAHGVLVRALRPLGRAVGRHAAGRAPCDAAVRTFLAHPLRQGRRRSRDATRRSTHPADCRGRSAAPQSRGGCDVACHDAFTESPYQKHDDAANTGSTMERLSRRLCASNAGTITATTITAGSTSRSIS